MNLVVRSQMLNVNLSLKAFNSDDYTDLSKTHKNFVAKKSKTSKGKLSSSNEIEPSFILSDLWLDEPYSSKHSEHYKRL